MTRTIGLCTSSRSERHLMQALVDEMNCGKYDLKAELVDIIRDTIRKPRAFDFLIIPADRTEMTKFALDCFHSNTPFCHYLAGSISHSNCHDDINRWLITLMSNFVFAESPEARTNVLKIGYPEDRVIITGTSHFDGITNYDIEAHKPSDAPEEPYDLILANPETQSTTFDHEPFLKAAKNPFYVVTPNEDAKGSLGPSKPHLEFLWLLKHCTNFISNSSATIYEVPYLNWRYGAKIKVINPSQRNADRTAIPINYLLGASSLIAKWCEEVDLEWLKTPKRYPHFQTGKLLELPK